MRDLESLQPICQRQQAENRHFIGLALDGSCAARCATEGCELYHPLYRRPDHTLVGYHHAFSMISVVGTGLPLPFDLEPYVASECEYVASQRLLTRAVTDLGPRFADYVVGDDEYATATWLHLAGDLGLWVIARLKGNLPELYAAAQQRFADVSPTLTSHVGRDHIELRDADDFEPWETWRWTTVRVPRYRQHKPDGSIVEAYWLTDFPTRLVGSAALYRLARSRWEIENQGFNEAKTYHAMEHITPTAC